MVIPSLRTGVLILVAASLRLMFSSALFADMKITKIKKNAESYEIVLNNDIKILNIFLRNDRLAFPQYKGKRKIYQQFSILKRDFRNSLLDALMHNKTFSGECITSFKVNKMSVLKNNSATKAFASVIFGDDIEVECRIISGRNSLWVAWPSNLKNDIWAKNFMFINRNLQKQVEKKLITEYTSGMRLNANYAKK
ncbi:MAG: SpoVG family protein [Endomicrobium sp.]|jgi:DNA-binding cell septation regulator SpoVG|nr:SpoVG family protein [Endomicrobium sp.]